MFQLYIRLRDLKKKLVFYEILVSSDWNQDWNKISGILSHYFATEWVISAMGMNNRCNNRCRLYMNWVLLPTETVMLCSLCYSSPFLFSLHIHPRVPSLLFLPPFITLMPQYFTFHDGTRQTLVMEERFSVRIWEMRLNASFKVKKQKKKQHSLWNRWRLSQWIISIC